MHTNTRMKISNNGQKIMFLFNIYFNIFMISFSISSKFYIKKYLWSRLNFLSNPYTKGFKKFLPILYFVGEFSSFILFSIKPSRIAFISKKLNTHVHKYTYLPNKISTVSTENRLLKKSLYKLHPNQYNKH